MKVKTISYSESHEMITVTGLKKWKKFGIEGEVGDDESVSHAYDQAVELVHGMLDGDNDAQTLEWKTDFQAPVPQPLQSIDYKAKEKLEIDIDNATTKEDLEFYVEAAEKCGLMELWNEKNNSLK